MIIKFEPKMNLISTSSFLEFVGNEILKKIKDLIKQSKNVNGEDYIGYEKSYEKLKNKTKVDLNDTGKMLSQIQMRITERRFIIEVKGDRELVAIKLNKYKNWTFLEWGSELEIAYQKAVDDFFKKFQIV